MLDEIRYLLASSARDNSIRRNVQPRASIKKEELDRYLKLVGREILRERTPDLRELAQNLENIELPGKYSVADESLTPSQPQNHIPTIGPISNIKVSGASIVTELIERGYLKDSQKWLTRKGFSSIGRKILMDIMDRLTSGEYGLHETLVEGVGSVVLDSTKKFDYGNDFRMMNVPKSMLNALQRNAKGNQQVQLPLQISIDDFEEYEMSHDVRISVVYCIDLSSTMRYSSMYGDLSRIEAAKKALWSLFIFNTRFFPSDSIYVVGFGALASQVSPYDIPYLRTFEPGGDFMHYTNYQSALRLSSKILTRDGSSNKRIVLITDGHPSACFIDNRKDYDDLISLRPYSHFYSPDIDNIQRVNYGQSLELDVHFGKPVYLCYRYRQVDEYIGKRTIIEAKKCRKNNIQIDTLMISEEDSLLTYVNQMEKAVRGKSYYINPGNIDKVLLTDYLKNRRATVRS